MSHYQSQACTEGRFHDFPQSLPLLKRLDDVLTSILCACCHCSPPRTGRCGERATMMPREVRTGA